MSVGAHLARNGHDFKWSFVLTGHILNSVRLKTNQDILVVIKEVR